MVTIFVEGSTDVNFMIAFIGRFFGVSLNRDDNIVDTNGYDGLFIEDQGFLNRLRGNRNNGTKNLVIFDADNKYDQRRNHILNNQHKNDVDMELFLFPDNKSTGDLESLLCHIANPEKYAPFSACFDPYADCLEKYKITYDSDKQRKKDKLKLSSSKSKWAFNSFCTLHNHKTPDFTDTKYWNLDSDALTPLYNFLAPHFSKPV